MSDMKVIVSQDDLEHIYSSGIVGIQVTMTETKELRDDNFSILVRLKDGLRRQGVNIGRFTSKENADRAAYYIDNKMLDETVKRIFVPSDFDAGLHIRADGTDKRETEED